MTALGKHWAIVALAAATLPACDPSECKEVRAEVSGICGAGNPAVAAVTDKGDRKEKCRATLVKLSEVKRTLARMNHKGRSDASKLFCEQMVQNSSYEDLTSQVESGYHLHRMLFSKSLQRQLEEAVARGDLNTADQLFAEVKAGYPYTHTTSAYILGGAYLEPRNKVRPPPGTPWQTVLLSRKKPHMNAGTTMGNNSRVQAPNLKRALKIYLGAKAYRHAAQVAYRRRDLPAYDRYLKAHGKETGLYDALRRINLLAAQGRTKQVEAAARRAAVRFLSDRTCVLVGPTVQCTRGKPDPPCGPMLVLAKLHEAAHRYSAARDAYKQAWEANGGSCSDVARGRLEALAGIADGKPLPRFRVTVSVNAPAGATVKVRLLPDVARTQNPTGLPSTSMGQDPDPGHMDHYSHSYVLKSREAQGAFRFESVPPGVWDLVVVAIGPTKYVPKGGWPAVRVSRADAEVGPIAIVPHNE